MAEDKAKGHEFNFAHMLKCVIMVLESVLLRGYKPLIVLELPTMNTYWSTTMVMDFERKFNLKRYKTVGCEFELRAEFEPGKGLLMLKPWTLSTSSGTIGKALARECTHSSSEHTSCAGKNTLVSENYPVLMAETLHKAFKHACRPVVSSASRHSSQ